MTKIKSNQMVHKKRNTYQYHFFIVPTIFLKRTRSRLCRVVNQIFCHNRCSQPINHQNTYKITYKKQKSYKYNSVIGSHFIQLFLIAINRAHILFSKTTAHQVSRISQKLFPLGIIFLPLILNVPCYLFQLHCLKLLREIKDKKQ